MGRRNCISPLKWCSMSGSFDKCMAFLGDGQPHLSRFHCTDIEHATWRSGGGGRRKKRPLQAVQLEELDGLEGENPDGGSTAGLPSGRRSSGSGGGDANSMHPLSPPHQRRRSTGAAPSILELGNCFVCPVIQTATVVRSVHAANPPHQ